MSRATLEMREFAGRLIAHERKANRSPPSALPPAFDVCEKLRPHLEMLMGRAGVRAVLGRALALVARERPHFGAVQLQADGSLAAANGRKGDADLRTEGGVLLVAELLGLLVAFIGEGLTLRMLREAWPKISLSQLYFRNEDQI